MRRRSLPPRPRERCWPNSGHRGYHVRPVYEWEKDSYGFKGYEGSNELKVKTARVHLLGSILAAVVKAVAKEIRYVSFSFSCCDRKTLEFKSAL
jgi:uncharacterized protein YggE